MARLGTRSAFAVLGRPRLWPTAVRQATRVARPGWWRRVPFLPLPDPDYLAFRLETQYGSEPGRASAVHPADLVRFLEWCRDQERALGPRSPGARR